MKTLTCKKCLRFLGEIEKGKIKKDVVLLCEECFQSFSILKSMDTYKEKTKETYHHMDRSASFTDLFGNYFNTKGKL
jgi:hypothetical protein